NTSSVAMTSEKQDNNKTFVGGVIEDVAKGLGLKKENETANAEPTLVAVSEGDAARKLASSVKSEGLELALYTKIGMGDGQQANNPWLQEFPDPITRTS